jgi:outer membrane protein assembly factor BamA
MQRIVTLIACLGLVAVSSLPVIGQQLVPQSIRFEGAPGYSDSELMAAAGLKPGAAVTADELNGDVKRLLNTGLFEKLSYNIQGPILIVSLTPSSQLLPIRLENLPLKQGDEFDAKLHDRVPLFHGKVPVAGGLLEEVRVALEAMLAAQNIKATVAAVPYTDQALRKVTAVSFTITSPQVQIGEIAVDAASQPLDAKAKELLNKITGEAYGTEDSAGLIETTLNNYYIDLGYMDAKARASQQGGPVVTAETIRMPFVVSYDPGRLYRINSVHLAPEMVVTQAEFDRQANIHPGDVADGARVRQNWAYLSRQYHNRGYIRAAIHVVPEFDRGQGTVSFAVSADPGPEYKMGTLTIENVTDQLRAAMMAAWKMPPGSVFNEGAILGFVATHGVNPALERVFAAVNLKYTLHPDDETRTVDVDLRLERRQ